jgi:hypothetical protein
LLLLQLTLLLLLLDMLLLPPPLLLRLLVSHLVDCDDLAVGLLHTPQLPQEVPGGSRKAQQSTARVNKQHSNRCQHAHYLCNSSC